MATNDSSSQQTTDRERNIQTGRDDSRTGGVARRPQSGVGSIGRMTPFSMMRRMAEDMDRFFDGFAMGRGRADFDWSPQVETFRRGNDFVVRADLPGLKKEDVKVEVDRGLLTIAGERCDEHEEERDDFYRSERSYGQFYRAVPLPEGVGDDRYEASFKDGVLEVTLSAPKQQERKARQVPIR